MSENMNDINHLDTEDEGLSQIFGDRFHDESKTPAAVKPATTRKSTTPKKKSAPAVVEPPKAEPVIPVQQPVESDSYSWLPQLKAAVHGIMPPRPHVYVLLLVSADGTDGFHHRSGRNVRLCRSCILPGR